MDDAGPAQEKENQREFYHDAAEQISAITCERFERPNSIILARHLG
jgi:hypothetical protein